MKIFLAIMWALIAMSSNAQGISRLIDRKIPGAPVSDSEIRIMADSDSESPSKANMQPQSALREGEHRVPVRIHFPLDEEWVMVNNIILLYNEEGYSETILVDNTIDYADVELPEGIYDLAAQFCKIDEELVALLGPTTFYIAEDVIIEPGKDIYMCPWESTICLNMETHNPQGEKNRFRKVKYTDWNDLTHTWNYEIIEEGNIIDILNIKYLFYNDHPLFEISEYAGGVNVEPGPGGYYDADNNCNIYVNQINGNYLFRAYQITIPLSQDELYLTVTEAKHAQDGIYSNSNNWVNEHTGIKSTSVFTELADSYYALWIQPFIKSNIVLSRPGLLGLNAQMVKNIWCSEPANNDFDEIYMRYAKELDELGIIDDNYIYTQSETAAYYPFTEEGKVISSLQPNEFADINPGNVIREIFSYPFNNGFNAPTDNMLLEAGESVPLLTSCPIIYWNYDEPILTYFYSGRLGEILGATGMTSQIKLNVDGKEVASSYYEAIMYMLENDEAGNYKFSFTADNFEIDNLKGGNIAEVTYTNGDGDSFPPSVTMLQFRNVNNDVTQNFNSPEDGEILISAADLEMFLEEDVVKLNIFTPERVTAWVTPYGSDSNLLSEINLTECEDLFDANGLGAFYKGSLADVNLSSPTGWFNLTIKVEDAAGNSQLQTLSPAFKIDSLTGVAETSENMGIRVVNNCILAPEHSHIYNVNGIETTCNNLPSGVYIVRTPNRVAKVIVR